MEKEHKQASPRMFAFLIILCIFVAPIGVPWIIIYTFTHMTEEPDHTEAARKAASEGKKYKPASPRMFAFLIILCIFVAPIGMPWLIIYTLTRTPDEVQEDVNDGTQNGFQRKNHNKVVCKYCGGVSDANANKCSNCGAPLKR